MGTRLTGDFILASGKDTCGDQHDVYVLKRVETISPFHATTNLAYPKSLVERVLPGGNGEWHSLVTRSNIKVFVTGACIPPEPVELVDTKISYDLENPVK